MMSQQILSIKNRDLGCNILSIKLNIFSIFLIISSIFVLNIHCAISDVNDAKFMAGYQSLFSQTLTSYPYASTYSIPYTLSVINPSTFYNLVISINTLDLMQCNTIGWNFTKSQINTSGFKLKYQAGINTVIYSLAINFMLVDDFYADYDIAYFNYRCSNLNHGIGYRSQNLSHTSKKFSNDSNYAQIAVFESFNMTNLENDNTIFRYIAYKNNLTVILEFYTVGLTTVQDFQVYLILYNNAYMIDTKQRIVFINVYSFSSIAVAPTYDSDILSQFKKKQRFFSGLSGFNFTRTTSRIFQFKFNVNQVFQYQLSSSVKLIDYSVLSTYVITCPSGFVFRQIDQDCISGCPTTQYPDTSHTLHFCRTCHYSCSTCWNDKQTSCKACSSPTRNQVLTATYGVDHWYSCYCDDGYFDNYTVVCLSCSTYLPGCAKCVNNVTCLACGSGMKLLSNKCICNNPAQIYFGSSCINRIIGCETHTYDGSNLICIQCYVQRNFTLNSTFECQCQQPFLQVIQDVNLTGEYWCNYICGDGKVGLGQPCDDGNTVSGDGCNNLCQVEDKFICSNSPGLASVCIYNQSIELIFHTAQRVLYQNTAVLNFTFQPSIYFMNQITDWSSLVVTSLPVSKISDDFKCPDIMNEGRCNLTLTVQYTQELQELQFSIYLKLSNHPKIQFNSRVLYFVPEGQITELTYQPKQHLDMIGTIHIIILVLTIMSLLIFLVSIYFEKMIGLELIMTVQYAYYLLTPIDNNPIQLVPFQQNIKYSTGFNQIYNYTYHRYAPLPTFLNHQFYQKQFLMNMNIMLLGLVLVMCLLIGVKFIKTCQEQFKKTVKQDKIFDDQDQNKRKKKFDIFYNFYWNKIFFTYVFFVIYQVLFNCVITTIMENPAQDIFSPSLNFLAEFLSLFIMIIGILSVGYWFYQGNRKKGRISLNDNQIIPYQFRLCTKEYILIYAIIQPIKIWVIAIFFTQKYCYFITISILAIYLVVLIILRPYKKMQDMYSNESQISSEDSQYNTCMSIHNFGICFNQFCLICFNVLYMMWNINGRKPEFTDQYPQIMLYCSITLVALLNIVAILRLLYKKIGAILFCDYFKQNNPNTLNLQNAYAKMRKLIRGSDLKGYDQNDINSVNNDDDKNNLYKKDKNKILQDVKKAKSFVLNWKDDPKTKYYYNKGQWDQAQNHYNNDQTVNKELNTNKDLQNSNDISFLNEFSSPNTKTKYQNPGIVQMQTLTKGLHQFGYKINKVSDKKVAQLNKSILDHLIQKKEFQMSNRKNNNSIYNELDDDESGKKGQQSLNDVKQRLRKQFQEKLSKQQKPELKSF